MQNVRNGTECSCMCKCHILMVLNSSSSSNNNSGSERTNSIYIHYMVYFRGHGGSIQSLWYVIWYYDNIIILYEIFFVMQMQHNIDTIITTNTTTATIPTHWKYICIVKYFGIALNQIAYTLSEIGSDNVKWRESIYFRMRIYIYIYIHIYAECKCCVFECVRGEYCTQFRSFHMEMIEMNQWNNHMITRSRWCITAFVLHKSNICYSYEAFWMCIVCHFHMECVGTLLT